MKFFISFIFTLVFHRNVREPESYTKLLQVVFSKHLSGAKKSFDYLTFWTQGYVRR